MAAGCEVAAPFSSLEMPCYTDYTMALADHEDYGERWQPHNGSGDSSVQDPSLGRHALAAWRYQSSQDTESVAQLGEMSWRARSTQEWGGLPT